MKTCDYSWGKKHDNIRVHEMIATKIIESEDPVGVLSATYLMPRPVESKWMIKIVKRTKIIYLGVCLAESADRK